MLSPKVIPSVINVSFAFKSEEDNVIFLCHLYIDYTFCFNLLKCLHWKPPLKNLVLKWTGKSLFTVAILVNRIQNVAERCKEYLQRKLTVYNISFSFHTRGPGWLNELGRWI